MRYAALRHATVMYVGEPVARWLANENGAGKDWGMSGCKDEVLSGRYALYRDLSKSAHLLIGVRL